MGKFYEDLKQVLGFTEQRNNKNLLDERNNYGGRFQTFTFGGSSSYTNDKAMLLSAVYRCVSCISDAISQLPLEPYKVDSKGYKKKLTKDPTYKILNATPNKRMTRYTFISLLVQSMLLNGNGYAYILRDKDGKVKELIFLPSSYVTIIPPKSIIDEVTYQVTGINGIVRENEIIHLLNYSMDGVVGISTLSFARHTLGLAHDAEKHARNFFTQGGALGGFIENPSIMSSKQKEDFKNSWIHSMGSERGASNGVAILDGGMKFNSVTISPANSQLLESRQFDVGSICRYFGVSPIKCFDLNHANYNSSEAANLSFLTDTLSPIMQKIELEFERKLYPDENIDVRFDTSALLRTDKSALSSYFREMIQNGIMSINECRKELDMLAIEGGDANVLQANMMALKNVVNNIPTNSAINNPIKETETPDKEEEKEPIKEEETQP